MWSIKKLKYTSLFRKICINKATPYYSVTEISSPQDAQAPGDIPAPICGVYMCMSFLILMSKCKGGSVSHNSEYAAHERGAPGRVVINFEISKPNKFLSVRVTAGFARYAKC